MTILADDELATAIELVTSLVSDQLDAEPVPEDPAGVELLALATQTPFCWPESPPKLAHALVRALGDRGDELAAGLLAAMERLASEPLAGLAAAEARALAARGVVSPHADAVGALAVAEAQSLEVGDGAAEVWLAVLTRPGESGVQPLTVFVEHAPCGAVITGATLCEPVAYDQASRVLDCMPGTPEALTAVELTRRLRDALDHMTRHEVALDVDAGRVLPLLERALTGRVGTLPRPPAAEPDPEEAARRDAELLVEDFAEHLEAADVGVELLEYGPFIAHTMLEWKLDYGDGEIFRWGLGDLREYLLDWFPREVTCGEDTVDVAPAAVIVFLGFLDAAELLDAPVPLAALIAAVKQLAHRFADACGDPRRWGPAKSLSALMVEDGVDQDDPEAVEAWIEDIPVRVFGERDAPARPAPARGNRDRRRAARRARKRNRR